MALLVLSANNNYNKAKEQMRVVAKEVTAEVLLHKIERVNLLLLGDLPHTVSGINHANNWKDLESNFWGAEAIIKPFELLAELVSNVPNLKGIYAVGGE